MSFISFGSHCATYLVVKTVSFLHEEVHDGLSYEAPVVDGSFAELADCLKNALPPGDSSLVK